MDLATVDDAQLVGQWRATTRARSESLRDYLRRGAGRSWRRSQHLEQLYDAGERIDRGEAVRIAVSMPPGHGKSTAVLGILGWSILRHPRRVSAYVSYSGPATRAKSSALRDAVTAGGLVPHPDLWSLGEWRAAVGGGLLAAGVGGRLTGDRLTGCLVVDDPFKGPKEASSPLIRDRVSEYLDAVALSRLVPGASAVVVHTRWDPDDLIGRLEQVRDERGAQAWTVIRLPAISDAGEALWPEVYPLEELDRIKRQLDARNPHLWPSLYQQTPVRKGGALFLAPARYESSAPRLPGARRVLGVDWAASAKASGDATAVVALDVVGRGADQRGRVLDRQAWRVEAPVALERVRAVELANPGCVLAMETNGIGKVQVQNYRRLYPGAHIVEVRRTSDKYAAAVGTATAWNGGRIAVPLGGLWAPALVTSAQGFTGRDGAEDDDVDALVNGWEGGGAGGTSSGSVSL